MRRAASSRKAFVERVAAGERLAAQAALSVSGGGEEVMKGAEPQKAVGEAIPGTYKVGGRRMSRSRDRVRDSSLGIDKAPGNMNS